MSIQLTKLVWAEHKKYFTGVEKAILLNLADRANDDHECYPSIARITSDTSFSKRTVISTLESLIIKKVLTKIRPNPLSKSKTNRYKINVELLTFLASVKNSDNNASAGAAPLYKKEVQELHPASAGAAPQLVQELHPNHKITINESSSTRAREPELISKKLTSDDDDFLEEFPTLEASSKQIKEAFQEYGKQRVREVVIATLAKKPTNPWGYALAILRNGSILPEPSKPAVASVVKRFPSREENIAWYQSLPVERKNEAFQAACFKHPYFEQQLQLWKASPLAADFVSTSGFSLMMQLLGRAL